MKTWEQARAEIKSFSESEKLEIKQLAHITAKIIKQRQRLGLRNKKLRTGQA